MVNHRAERGDSAIMTQSLQIPGTRKHARPTGMLMTMPCAGVPVMTPRRPVALVRANVAADKIARTAPKSCTSLVLNRRMPRPRPVGRLSGPIDWVEIKKPPVGRRFDVLALQLTRGFS